LSISALVGDRLSASRPCRFTPGGRKPLNRSLGGPQRLSGQYGEVKILDPTGTRTPASQFPRAASRFTDCKPEGGGFETLCGQILPSLGRCSSLVD
jgi:hypothetical protein